MITAWLAAFLLTQAVEVPVYARALRGRRHRLLWAFGASALTHPLIFLALPRVWTGSYAGYVSIAEAVAVGGEAIYLAALRVPRSVAWSLAANAASVAAGLLTRALWSWP
ncbi:MAG: hypothetical protein KC549_14305 [Myxococcales bacterium]|nr:hypothetical protein [Myxococcales bacterium]MCB9547461.1 hypothetical protein [Myxococcales bacterium]